MVDRPRRRLLLARCWSLKRAQKILRRGKTQHPFVFLSQPGFLTLSARLLGGRRKERARQGRTSTTKRRGRRGATKMVDRGEGFLLARCWSLTQELKRSRGEGRHIIFSRLSQPGFFTLSTRLLDSLNEASWRRKEARKERGKGRAQQSEGGEEQQRKEKSERPESTHNCTKNAKDIMPGAN